MVTPFQRGVLSLRAPLPCVKRGQKGLHLRTIHPLFIVEDSRAVYLLKAHPDIVLYVARADAPTRKDVDPSWRPFA